MPGEDGGFVAAEGVGVVEGKLGAKDLGGASAELVLLASEILHWVCRTLETNFEFNTPSYGNFEAPF